MVTSRRSGRSWVYILAALACVMATPASAATSTWQVTGLGGGGGIFLPVSSPHDPKLMFCASDMSGVYRSTDGGLSWQLLPWRQLCSTLACPVTFHPTDADVCYAVPGPYAANVLKVSRDKGLTWQVLYDGKSWAADGQVGQIALDPAGKIMLVAAAKATYRSDDGGKGWTKVEGISGPAWKFFFEPPRTGKDLCCAATDGGVLVSDDGAKTFKPAGGKPPAERIESFCAGADAATGKVVLYCSVRSSGQSEGKFAGGIFRSDDRGASWVSAMGPGINTEIGRRVPGLPGIAQYPAIGMAENQTDVVYAWCYGTGNRPPHHTTIYRTADGGRSWKAVLFGPQYMPGHNVELGWLDYENWAGGSIISFIANSRRPECMAFSNAVTLYVTQDGGSTWRQAYTRCAEENPSAGKRWETIGLENTTTWWYKFDPHDASRTYICYTDLGFARSLDRGKTLYHSTAGCPWSNTWYGLAFDPDVPGKLYGACADRHDIPSWKMADGTGGGGGVCVSADWGKTWYPMSKGLGRGACMAVIVDPKSPKDKRALYACMNGGGVFKSSDGGESWSARNKGLELETNSHFTDLKRCADGTLYALCGAKRQERKSLAPGNLFKSSDDGETWVKLTGPMDWKLPYGFDVHPDDPNTLYVGVCTVPAIHDPAGIYKSADGGKTWTKCRLEIPPGVPYVNAGFPAIDPYNPKRLWCPVSGLGLMLSSDAGATWRECKGFPFGPASRVTVDPRDHETIWVSTFGGGVWYGPAGGTE